MSAIPPWSHSTLTAFETCPRKYYHVKVKKDVVEPPGEAAVWGTTVHKALEDRALGAAELPATLVKYEPVVSSIVEKEGELLVEHKFSIDKSFQPTDWKTSWCRGIVDLGKIAATKATLFDWKTGKRKPGSDQMKLMALLTFGHYPNVQTVSTGFIWLKNNKIDREKFTREQTPILWQEFLPRVTRMERAYESDKWPAKPSGLCKNYCYVKSCEFCGR